ncbi:hypothetical protein ACW0US_17880 [Xanthomonas euvesicatoria]
MKVKEEMKGNKKQLRGALKLCGQSAMVLTGLAMLIFVPAAQAAGIADIAKRLSESMGDIAWLAQTVFVVLGIIMVGGGVLGFIQDMKTQGNGKINKATAIAMVLGGGLLGYMGSLMTTAGDTVWGDGKGSRAKIELSQ